MAFKPFRDSRPMKERPIEIQAEANFFSLINFNEYRLSKKQQGRIMGAFRKNLESFPLQGSCKTKLSESLFAVAQDAAKRAASEKDYDAWLVAMAILKTYHFAKEIGK